MAAKKKAVKKKVVSKRVGTSQTKKSVITKKAPSPRLKKRRKANTKAGYYPNPIFGKKKWVSGMIVNGEEYFISTIIKTIPLAADTDEKTAVKFGSKSEAVKMAGKVRNMHPDKVIFVRQSNVR